MPIPSLRRIVQLGLAIVTIHAPQSTAAQATSLLDAQRVERLAALADLYGAVAYFHPAVANTPTRRAAWDTIVGLGVEAVLRAPTAGEYRTVVQRMIDWIADPATRVLSVDAAPQRSLSWYSRREPDGTLIVALVPSRTGPQASVVIADVARASRVVFDLRVGADVNITAAFADAGFANQLATVVLATSRQRTRRYSGHPPEPDNRRTAYSANWALLPSQPIAPNPAVVEKRVAFVLGAGAEVPPVALALQRAGLGAIIAEGGVLATAATRSYRVRLSDGVEVMVRTADLVNPDGTTGARADTTVAQRTGSIDAGIAAALLWLARPPTRPMEVPLDTSVAPVATPTPTTAAPPTFYPSTGLRVISAFRLWNVVRHFFPYRHLIAENWDVVLREAIPSLVEAGDSIAYIGAVARMATHLHDSHVAIAGPAAPLFWGKGDLPVYLRMIERVPVVAGFYPDSATDIKGLAVGDVVISIDGEPWQGRVDRMARYITASTPQALTLDVLEHLFRGSIGSEIAVVVRGAEGVERTVHLKRAAVRRFAQPKRTGPVWQILAGNIGYVDLDRLTRPEVDSMLDALSATRAIIFDMRGYPNAIAWPLAPRLKVSDQEGVSALLRRPVVSSADTTERDAMRLAMPAAASTKSRYVKPTVMLIDERAVSEAEHTGLYLRAASGTRFVGTPTQGADGDITWITLPGSIVLSFTGQSFTWPDGKELQRTGLQPDVLVAPTIAGIRAGRDEVLERAIAVIKQGR